MSSFNFSSWASHQLQKIEGSLDEAFSHIEQSNTINTPSTATAAPSSSAPTPSSSAPSSSAAPTPSSSAPSSSVAPPSSSSAAPSSSSSSKQATSSSSGSDVIIKTSTNADQESPLVVDDDNVAAIAAVTNDDDDDDDDDDDGRHHNSTSLKRIDTVMAATADNTSTNVVVAATIHDDNESDHDQTTSAAVTATPIAVATSPVAVAVTAAPVAVAASPVAVTAAPVAVAASPVAVAASLVAVTASPVAVAVTRDNAANIAQEISASESTNDDNNTAQTSHDCETPLNNIAFSEDSKQHIQNASNENRLLSSAPHTTVTLPDINEISLRLRRREAQLRKQAKIMAILQKKNQKLQQDCESMEKKFAQTSDQNLRLSEQCATLEQNRQSHEQTEALLRAKDEKIAAIFSEGEQLSRQQAKMETLVRTVRGEIKTKTKRIEELEQSLEKTSQSLSNAVEQSNVNASEITCRIERIATLTARVQELELKLADAEQNQACLNTANATVLESEEKAAQWREKAKLFEDAESRRAAIAQTMETELSAGAIREEALRVNIRELRARLVAIEESSCHELKDLEVQREESAKQLRSAEQKAEHLASTIPLATRPLLLQIETLRTNASKHASSWKQLEKQLLTRCEKAENELTIKHREYLSLSSSLNDMKAEHKNKIDEIDELKSELSVATNRLQCAQQTLVETQLRGEEGQRQRDEARVELSSATRALEQSNTELLKRQKKLDDSERQVATLTDELSKRDSSEYGKSNKHSQPMINECMNETNVSSSLSSDTHTESDNNIDTSSFGGDNIFVHSSIRHKDGMIGELKRRIREIEAERDLLSDEIVCLRSNMLDMSEELKRVQLLERKLNELSVRHETALELIGRQTDENAELKDDIADVKALYSAQISELADQMKALRQRYEPSSSSSSSSSS